MFENAFKVCKMCSYDPKYFFLEKNAEFNADFKFVDSGFQKCSLQKLKAKNHEKMHKNENTKNLHSFLALVFLGHLFKSASTNLKSA
jgi:hypothetical protein